MKIKTIRILEEIVDLELDSLDVLVECENGYTYVYSVSCRILRILQSSHIVIIHFLSKKLLNY